jgi:hypothetical protein
MTPETLATAIRIAEALESSTVVAPTNRIEYVSEVPTSRYCVVRGDRSGVFCGIVESEDGSIVEMTDVRHVWYWAGASGTDELAIRGVADPDGCKFTAPAQRIRVLDAITVLDCTAEAETSLRSVKDWSQFK